MSKKSRCDAWGHFHIDFPRDADGKPIPQKTEELVRLEDNIQTVIRVMGYKVRAWSFDVKEGRALPPEEKHDG